MKRLFIILAAVMMTAGVITASKMAASETVACVSGAPEAMLLEQGAQKQADLNFKLYPTQNTSIFLLLDTRDGRIWIEQWGSKKEDRFETTLSTYKRVSNGEEMPGRFKLYPTSNMYNFIMVDQVNGKIWQVRWSLEKEGRMVVRIN